MSKGEVQESKWRKVITEMQSSGKAQRSWCKEQGINYHTMRNWYTKLNQVTAKVKENAEKSTEWLEVSGGSEVEEAAAINPIIQVQVGCFTINVTSNFEKNTFYDICKTLVNLC